ncbi:MAG: FAD:protein FMN transferase [Bacteroidales bacterium]|nr:FAD:protein FMN transferase [Bacteroidales bacterium]
MKRFILIPLVLLVCSLSFVSCRKNGESGEMRYIKETGFVFGTTYHITYRYDRSLESEMLERLRAYDNSLSTYNKNSVISKINRNEDVELDSFFVTVYNKAKEFYELSGHRFDITIKPLSRLWKFGGDTPDTISVELYDEILAKVDSVREFIGFDKTRIENNRLVKDDERICLEAAALAEGYGIDVAASVFDDYGVSDYMVEIGGEMHIKGLNPNGRKWRVSIDRPDDKSNELTRTSQTLINVTNCAISTSGSYRQFYRTADGRRLQHTIDPRVGRPVEHGMLSVTIVGPNTMTTDAISTSCMVIGPDSAMQFVESFEDVEAYMIYEDETGNRKELFSDGFRELLN